MWREARAAMVYVITIAGILISAHGISSVVTVCSESIPIDREYCIVIDAGHGGEDGGAISCSGISESVYNLDIAVRVNDLLCLLGYDTKMIRDSDISIYTKGSTLAQKKISDLKERVRIVNETENAVLLSIHQNFFADSRSSGPQVFYAAAPISKALAETVQNTLWEVLQPHKRRMCKKCSGIYLMEHISCGGILVECGFLSNPEEEMQLRMPEYQKRIGCAVVASVDHFLSNT